jgi:hypothetical protein
MSDKYFADTNLYSEVLSDGQTYRGVRVVNPLRTAE